MKAQSMGMGMLQISASRSYTFFLIILFYKMKFLKDLYLELVQTNKRVHENENVSTDFYCLFKCCAITTLSPVKRGLMHQD